MRVTLCVDAIDPQLTGIGRYTWELAKRLRGRADLEEVNFFARNRLIEDPGRLVRGEPIYQGRWARRTLRRWQTQQAFQSTLVHGTNFFLPDNVKSGIVTVHDLSVLRFPETHPIERVEQFERQLARSVQRAKHVITDTETIKKEVIAEFSLAPETVTAVPLGVDENFQPRSQNEVSEHLKLLPVTPGAYGLCVATLEPRKRIAALLSAWRGLPREVRDRFPLVLAGGKGWRDDGILVEIARGGAEGWLRHLGFVDEKRLPYLYAGASLFVYPSVYEGFGLPPLEAMASGVPVLVSNCSCMPEVCGPAARYIDPSDVGGMTRAIEAALMDEEWRARARTEGSIHASKFTWDRCVDQTLAVYQSVWQRLPGAHA